MEQMDTQNSLDVGTAIIVGARVVGATVGLAVITVGVAEAIVVGAADPSTLGAAEANIDGEADPITVGAAEPIIVGEADGKAVGATVAFVSCGVGAMVGAGTGADEGAKEGDADGAAVTGALVGAGTGGGGMGAFVGAGPTSASMASPTDLQMVTRLSSMNGDTSGSISMRASGPTQQFGIW